MPSLDIPFPIEMLLDTREGRYAVDVSDEYGKKWIFLRINRPKVGKYKDWFVVKTQSSEAYFPLVYISPDRERMFQFQHSDRIKRALAIAVFDPTTSAINYGRELGRCSRCGKELTDERSRYYSIGPECEKYWPDIIETINDTEGEFQA